MPLTDLHLLLILQKKIKRLSSFLQKLLFDLRLPEWVCRKPSYVVTCYTAIAFFKKISSSFGVYQLGITLYAQ